MPSIESTKLGHIDYPEDHVLHFPFGLPAFEDETRFLAVERPGLEPVVFLQSLQRPELAFVALPVKALEPGFELALTEDEVAWLNAEKQGAQPATIRSAEPLADDLIAFALVTLSAQGMTANLRAPVVVNQRTRVGLQAIQADSSYSSEHVIQKPADKEAECS